MVDDPNQTIEPTHFSPNENPFATTAPAAPKRRSAEAKWGREVMAHGFVMVPAILLRGQKRIGLTPTQLAIVLNLISWWTDADKEPWSSKALLSGRIGITERQFQRQVKELEKAGLVERKEKITSRGKRPNGYDLAGLVKRLQELAPAFKEAKAAMINVEKRGGGKSKTK